MDLCEKLCAAKQSVSCYTSAIEQMKSQRDVTLSDIQQFQLGLDVRSCSRSHCKNFRDLYPSRMHTYCNTQTTIYC